MEPQLRSRLYQELSDTTGRDGFRSLEHSTLENAQAPFSTVVVDRQDEGDAVQVAQVKPIDNN